MLDRAAERLRAIDDTALAARIDGVRQIAGAQLLAERYADAAATAARGLATARRTNRQQSLVALLHCRAGALGNLLELDAARREIDTAEEAARLQGIPHPLAFILWQSAIIHRFQAGAPQAARDAAEFTELAATLEPNPLVRTGLCSVAAIRAEEDPERCLHRIASVAGPTLGGVLPSWWASLLLTMVRCALALGRADDAHRWAALARERAAALRLPASVVRSQTATAEVLLATGHADRAATLALSAAAAGERTRTLRDAAEAQLIAGRALTALGETEQARTVLQRLATDSVRGGAFQLNRAAARELRRVGARPSAETRRATHRRTDAQLTAREQQVADLVATGRSNKQIAGGLHLSEKTVEATLTRVYAKLGIRSRTQLASAHRAPRGG